MRAGRFTAALLATLTLPCALAAPGAAQQPDLAVAPDPAAEFRPRVVLGPVLADDALLAAAREGLPVRVRLRVELWQDRFLDALLAEQAWERTIWYDPIRSEWGVRSVGEVAIYPTWELMRGAVEGVSLLQMRPRGEGRFYYTATLEVETLSVSDLEELERWLQGELRPAVAGERSLPGAVGQGAKRLLIRLLDLPARHVEARSGRFHFPPTEG